MTTALIILIGIELAFAIDLAIVALCYAIIAWAFGIMFSWPIAIAIAVVLMFIIAIFKGSK